MKTFTTPEVHTGRIRVSRFLLTSGPMDDTTVPPVAAILPISGG